jgi:UDP-N-acetylglucosamine 4,6-dehydratase/5-epimerase
MIKKKNKKLISELMIKNELKNKIILITGGAGSIGSALTRELLNYPIKSIRVFDNDEHSLFQLKQSLNNSKIDLLLGDILDKDRIDLAVKDADIIIHTAALKNIEITEYNPFQTIDTNVNGTVNLLKMVIKHKPKKFINISTDKVVESSTLYATTKQIGERLTSWAGKHMKNTKFATIRFGNVIETRGNVFEVWKKQAENNQALSITDPKMKRYFFHMDEATNFIIQCLVQMKTGEIMIPKMKLYTVKDLATKISKKQKIIGFRQGEKLQEILITDEEKKNSQNKENMWIIKQYS